jgi:hypothetical protein
MSKYVLNICYSTYCRGEQFLKDIQSLLTDKDNRFRITIQDNHSEDGSFEALKEISDPRLTLRQNASNLTAHPNHKLALANNPDAEYLLFSIDKDYVDPEHISEFIDYLEKEKPVFGYLNLYHPKGAPVKHYRAGRDAMKYLAYLCKHPSGYFWKNNIYSREIEKAYFKNLPMKFDWWFDLITAHLAAEYPGAIVDIPVYIHALYRQEYISKPSHTLSYDESNIYFGYKKRMENFELMVKDLLDLNLMQKDKSYIAFRMTKRLSDWVTVSLRHIYLNKRETLRYNLTSRKIGWFEMQRNVLNALALYFNLMYGRENVFGLLLKSCTIGGWSMLKSTKLCIKEIIRKPVLK